MQVRDLGIGVTCGLVVLKAAFSSAGAVEAAAPYPAMAPLAQYLMVNADEIAMAMSAGPSSISAHAEILTLGREGYKMAIKGNNGFVCLVERSWAAGFADAEFWNPKFRAPTCYNRAAARSVLPRYFEKTGWVLAGVSMSDMIARTRAELSTNRFMLPETGAMEYMLSKQMHLHDADGHWHPHVMFDLANTEAVAWGANLAGSPIFADDTTIFGQKSGAEPVIRFFVLVPKWSDGTPATMEGH